MGVKESLTTLGTASERCFGKMLFVVESGSVSNQFGQRQDGVKTTLTTWLRLRLPCLSALLDQQAGGGELPKINDFVKSYFLIGF